MSIKEMLHDEIVRAKESRYGEQFDDLVNELIQASTDRAEYERLEGANNNPPEHAVRIARSDERALWVKLKRMLRSGYHNGKLDYTWNVYDHVVNLLSFSQRLLDCVDECIRTNDAQPITKQFKLVAGHYKTANWATARQIRALTDVEEEIIDAGIDGSIAQLASLRTELEKKIRELARDLRQACVDELGYSPILSSSKD